MWDVISEEQVLGVLTEPCAASSQSRGEQSCEGCTLCVYFQDTDCVVFSVLFCCEECGKSATMGSRSQTHNSVAL